MFLYRISPTNQWLFKQASHASPWSQLLRHGCFNHEFQDAKARKIIPVTVVSGTVDGRNAAIATWEVEKT